MDYRPRRQGSGYRGRGSHRGSQSSYRERRGPSHWGSENDSSSSFPQNSDRTDEGAYERRDFSNSERGHRGGRHSSGHDRGGNRPPPGLRGRDIGMWYARNSKHKKAEHEKRNTSYVGLEKDQEQHLTGLLASIKSADQASTSNSDRKQGSYSSLANKDFLPLDVKSEGKIAVNYCNEENKSDFLFEYHQHKLENRRRNEEDAYMDDCISTDDSQSLNQDSKFDSEQLERFKIKQSSREYQRMLTFRKKLPSYKMKDELLKVIKANQAVVISGETGCGKTTQVSQFILDDYIERGEASLCRIVCTQPRRISAISVAERVADERCERCGENSVGFQIRLEKKAPHSRGSILYCTTGIMLQWLANNPLLLGTTHIILDEIHERDLHSDFLMIILRDVLPKRPDLKLILMSATLNAEMFSSYYSNCPTMNIPGFTYPVADNFLEDVVQMLKYTPQQQQNRRRFQRYGGFKRGDREQEQREKELYETWCDDLMYDRYHPETIEVLKEMDCKEVDVDLTCELISHISKYKPNGAILVFVPGWEKIKKIKEQLTSQSYFRNGKFRIIPLHSMLPTVNQREVFERPPEGVRKIIIATNIAETSITIEDIVYVIDCGKIKLKNFDAESNIVTLQAEWVSHANARQRRGRAGRVQDGECYHLFTRYHQQQLDDYLLPEILRTRLEELCLKIKLLKLGRILPFVQKAMQPPSLEALERSVEMLQDLNALDDKEDLTPLGFHLAKMPVDPQSGKMLLFAAMFSCLDPILTIAASLSYKDAFYVPMGMEDQALKRKRSFANGSQSDHIMLANAFQCWEDAKRSGNVRHFCDQNFMSHSVLQLLSNMRKQFCEILHETKFISSANPQNTQANLNSKNETILKAVICAGLYPNVGKLINKPRKYVSPKFETKQGRAELHFKSVNAAESDPFSRWCVYYMKQKTSKVYLYDATNVSPLSILLFGHGIKLGQITDKHLPVTVDNWISFASSQRIAELVQEFRQEFDKLLEYKISHPGSTNWDESSKEGALMRAIIDLISREDVTTTGSIDYDEAPNQ